MDNIIAFDEIIEACQFEQDIILSRCPDTDFWKSKIGQSQWAVFSNFEASLMGWEVDYRATGTISKITIKDVANFHAYVEVNGYESQIVLNLVDLTSRILDS
jgi:hypothetical protein